MTQKALVTGGAGFIGSNLALELEKKGYEVIIADTLNPGKEQNLKGLKAIFRKLDISRPFEIKEKLGVIFHEAAITDPRFEDDKEMIRANVEGFKNMIALAQKNNAKLIYASTAALYGNGPVPMKEDQEKDLFTAYATSKMEMDRLAERYFDKMHIVGLRYFNVFGPREAHKGRAASMIYHLSRQMKAGRRPRIFKFGEQKRDHIYVKDTVAATLKAVNSKSGIYNVGTGIATTFNELIEVLNDVLGTNYEPEYFDNPYTATYQANTQAHTEKSKKGLGFEARYSLKEGVEEYMEWLT